MVGTLDAAAASTPRRGLIGSRMPIHRNRVDRLLKNLAEQAEALDRRQRRPR